jgi:hypothetical protein
MTERSEKIFFRLDPIVAAQLKSRSQSLGLTVSEFLRLSVLSALGVCVPCDPKGLKEASKGNDDAQ